MIKRALKYIAEELAFALSLDIADVNLDNLQKIYEKRERDGLNVSDTGKIISAIRSLARRRVLAWGARMLDGNSNKWRYVSVCCF